MAEGDVCVLRVVGRYQAQNIVNTLHWYISAQQAEENAILARLISLFSTAVETAWLAAHISSYELIGFKAFRVTGVAKVPAYMNRGQNGTVSDTEVRQISAGQ